MKKLTKIYLNKSKNNMVMSKKLSSIIFQRFDQGDRVTYVAAFDKEQAVAIMLAFDKDKKLQIMYLLHYKQKKLLNNIGSEYGHYKR